MKIGILTDDNSGLAKADIQNLPIEIIRMPILIDGKCVFENESITEDDFFKKQKQNLHICTSQPSPGEVLSIWNMMLIKYDQIIYIPMSSGLSNTFSTADTLSNDYSNKVFVVNNHRISLTLRRSVFDCLNLINKGYDGKKIRSIMESEANKSSIYIMVDTLVYLKKGGRVTPAGCLIGNTLHLKPILTIEDGKLDAKAKAIGTKNAKKTMIELLKKDLSTKFKNDDFSTLEFGIAYTHNYKDALEFKKEIEKEINPSNLIMNPLSLSISAHIGPGSLAVTISKIIN